MLILARTTVAPKKVERLSFLTKYLELQRAMFYHNNALTSSHPYASQPISWPFLLRGVSFWTKGDEIRQQIYFIGNPVGWWISVAYLAILTGILAADQVTRRRGIESIDERTSLFFKTNVSRPNSSVQFNRILLPRLGSPLFPLLSYGPSIILASLSPCTSLLVSCCWRINPVPLLTWI